MESSQITIQQDEKRAINTQAIELQAQCEKCYGKRNVTSTKIIQFFIEISRGRVCACTHWLPVLDSDAVVCSECSLQVFVCKRESIAQNKWPYLHKTNFSGHEDNTFPEDFCVLSMFFLRNKFTLSIWIYPPSFGTWKHLANCVSWECIQNEKKIKCLLSRHIELTRINVCSLVICTKSKIVSNNYIHLSEWKLLQLTMKTIGVVFLAFDAAHTSWWKWAQKMLRLFSVKIETISMA